MIVLFHFYIYWRSLHWVKFKRWRPKRQILLKTNKTTVEDQWHNFCWRRKQILLKKKTTPVEDQKHNSCWKPRKRLPVGDQGHNSWWRPREQLLLKTKVTTPVEETKRTTPVEDEENNYCWRPIIYYPIKGIWRHVILKALITWL